MAKKTRTPFTPVAPKYTGTHVGCGGKVHYLTTASAGWLSCECGASTMRGALEVSK